MLPLLELLGDGKDHHIKAPTDYLTALDLLRRNEILSSPAGIRRLFITE